MSGFLNVSEKKSCVQQLKFQGHSMGFRGPDCGCFQPCFALLVCYSLYCLARCLQNSSRGSSASPCFLQRARTYGYRLFTRLQRGGGTSWVHAYKDLQPRTTATPQLTSVLTTPIKTRLLCYNFGDNLPFASSSRLRLPGQSSVHWS